MARTSVLTTLGSLLLLALSCDHASAAVHRVKLAKRSDEEFVSAKISRARSQLRDHLEDDADEPK